MPFFTTKTLAEGQRTFDRIPTPNHVPSWSPHRSHHLTFDLDASRVSAVLGKPTTPALERDKLAAARDERNRLIGEVLELRTPILDAMRGTTRVHHRRGIEREISQPSRQLPPVRLTTKAASPKRSTSSLLARLAAAIRRPADHRRSNDDSNRFPAMFQSSCHSRTRLMMSSGGTDRTEGQQSKRSIVMQFSSTMLPPWYQTRPM